MRLPPGLSLCTDHPMNLYLRVYLAGHSGRVMPRWLRRIAARPVVDPVLMVEAIAIAALRAIVAAPATAASMRSKDSSR